MIKEHTLDIHRSKEFYNKCRGIVKIKECYNNIFNVSSHIYNPFVNGELKIAFGYVLIMDNMFARHCFIVDNNGNAIDPTIVSTSTFKEDKEHRYLSFDILEFNDYIDLLDKYEGDASLFKHYIESERLARDWAEKHSFVLLG